METSLRWLHQLPDWPKLTWHKKHIEKRLNQIYRLMGRLDSYSELLPDPDRDQLVLEAMFANLSAWLQTEPGQDHALYAGLVRQTGIRKDGINPRYPADPWMQKVIQLYFSLFRETETSLTVDMLNQWQQDLSQDDEDPLQPYRNQPELQRFLHWFNRTGVESATDPVIRVAVAHLWFASINPAPEHQHIMPLLVSHMALHQADTIFAPLSSMYGIWLQDSDDYHQTLLTALTSGLDITDWIERYLDYMARALQQVTAEAGLNLRQSTFWARHGQHALKSEQIKVLDKLLDRLDQQKEIEITASEYVRIAGVSKATATRHLSDLLEKGLVYKTAGGGRSTSYGLAV